MLAAASDLPLAMAHVCLSTPEAAEGFAKYALRSRSPLAADAIALAATGGSHSLQELLSTVGDGVALDHVWGAAAGRLIALGLRPDAWDRGAAVLEEVLRSHPIAALSPPAVTLWAQLLLRLGRDDELLELLSDDNVPLDQSDRWALRADLANPWRVGQPATAELERRWLNVFNEIYGPDELEPIELDPVDRGTSEKSSAPYQWLRSLPNRPVDGELVTVVMSAFKPGLDLLTAARSVLDQSWANLELLVVDDETPPGYEELFEEVASLDNRVRVIRAPRNAGTYAARNLALEAARGKWITFQDSDDWTHPRRIEHQVTALLQDPRLISCRSWTLRAFPDLTLTYVGYPSQRLNASSLLLDRLATVRIAGGFDFSRKSADMELPLRLRAARPGSHRDLRHPAPLAITQLRADSLSRADAVPGWTVWTRLAYRDLYNEWHRRIASGRADARWPARGRPFALPDPTWAPDRGVRVPRDFDVVVMGDLRNEHPDCLRTVALAESLAGADLRVGLAHTELPAPPPSGPALMSPRAAALINRGDAELTHVSEPDRTQVLIVATPAAMLHVDQAGIQAAQVLVLSHTPPSGDLPADLAGWNSTAVDERCAELFDKLPWWGGPIFSRPDIREALPKDRLVSAELGVVLDPESMQVPGRSRWNKAHEAPVVGHHLPDHGTRWPQSARSILAAYPDRPGMEVHLLHGTDAARRRLKRPVPPPSWCSFKGTGMTTREFLSHLDVFVYQGDWDDVAEVAALEALAAGIPCVLPVDAATSMTASLDGDESVPMVCVLPQDVLQAVGSLTTMSGHEMLRLSLPDRRQRTWVDAIEFLCQYDTGRRGGTS